MLTIKALLNLTPSKVRYRASFPSFKFNKEKPTEKARYIFTKVSLGNNESTGDTYALTLRCHGTKKNPKEFKLTPDSLVWVHCSCPYFTYYLETCLQLHGSSSIRNSNADMPKITNPRLRPYLCKHLYAFMLMQLSKDKRKS